MNFCTRCVPCDYVPRGPWIFTNARIELRRGNTAKKRFYLSRPSSEPVYRTRRSSCTRFELEIYSAEVLVASILYSKSIEFPKGYVFSRIAVVSFLASTSKRNSLNCHKIIRTGWINGAKLFYILWKIILLSSKRWPGTSRNSNFKLMVKMLKINFWPTFLYANIPARHGQHFRITMGITTYFPRDDTNVSFNPVSARAYRRPGNYGVILFLHALRVNLYQAQGTSCNKVSPFVLDFSLLFRAPRKSTTRTLWIARLPASHHSYFSLKMLQFFYFFYFTPSDFVMTERR